jgi:hypothetical protein
MNHGGRRIGESIKKLVALRFECVKRLAAGAAALDKRLSTILKRVWLQDASKSEDQKMERGLINVGELPYLIR